MNFLKRCALALLLGVILPFVSAAMAQSQVAPPGPAFYYGIDMSPVSERKACGAVFRAGNTIEDPYALMASLGANLIRIRLWVDPETWTDFGGLRDVAANIQEARQNGMKVLLDIHYSDRWADSTHQQMPAAWRGIPEGAPLATQVYQYTANVLKTLNQQGLMPDIVKVGNEINNGFVMRFAGSTRGPMNWSRDIPLLNAAIQAVRDAGSDSSIKPQVMLHVAGPNDAVQWLSTAYDAGLSKIDLFGFSYYHVYSGFNLPRVGRVIERLERNFGVGVMVAETTYPSTLEEDGKPSPLLTPRNLVDGFPATPQGQNDYMAALSQTVKAAGGAGVIYWAAPLVDITCPPSIRAFGTSGMQPLSFFDRNDVLNPYLNYMRQR